MDIKPLTFLPVIEGIKDRSFGGVRPKPATCSSCPMAQEGSGFCPDWKGKGPIKLAFLLEAPGPNEILYHKPLVGKAGLLWEYAFFKPLGLSRDEVIIANTIRCFPGYDKKTQDIKYPIGYTRDVAERTCRQYDGRHGEDGELVHGGIEQWNPNLFYLTYHPAAVLRTRAYFFLVKKNVQRAFEFSRMGYRVCIVMGGKGAALVMSHIEGSGGLDTWNGHWFEGEWRTRKEKGFKQI